MEKLKRLVSFSVVFGSLVPWLLSASGTQPVLPDASSGQVDGHPAILFWPAAADGETVTLLDPANCRTRVIPKGTMEELEFPCGDWFVPPIGSYTGWIESDEWISTSTLNFTYGGGPFRGAGTRVRVPVVPAGSVRVALDELPRGETARYLSLDGAGQGIERRVSLDAAARGVRMPARRAVVGIFDPEGNALALSRPFEVIAGKTTTARVHPPSEATLLTVMAKPQGEKPRRFELALETEKGARKPDFELDTPGRLFAGWYEVAAGAATLRLRSPDGASIQTIEVALLNSKVTTVREQIKPIRRAE